MNSSIHLHGGAQPRLRRGLEKHASVYLSIKMIFAQTAHIISYHIISPLDYLWYHVHLAIKFIWEDSLYVRLLEFMRGLCVPRGNGPGYQSPSLWAQATKKPTSNSLFGRKNVIKKSISKRIQGLSKTISILCLACGVHLPSARQEHPTVPWQGEAWRQTLSKTPGKFKT